MVTSGLGTGVESGDRMALAAAHRRFLLLEQGIGAAVFNLLLNGVIAWLMVRSLSSVPTWGTELSVVGDTVVTAFLLPFFTCLTVTRLAHGRVARGLLPALAWRRSSHALLGRLPARTLPRALVLGLACAVALGPVAVWSFAALEVREMGTWPFIAFKAAFAAALAALVTPVIALGALGDAGAVTSPADRGAA